MGSFADIVLYDAEPAVLRCSGDEDRASQSLRRPAMSRALTAGRDVVADLTELVFADASLMVDLAIVARRLRRTGRRLRVRGASPQILRLIELVGLDRMPSVVVERQRPLFA